MICNPLNGGRNKTPLQANSCVVRKQLERANTHSHTHTHPYTQAITHQRHDKESERSLPLYKRPAQRLISACVRAKSDTCVCMFVCLYVCLCACECLSAIPL
ncbi:unnamed protein product [Ceratitis capitata]|uniref:(Mediterranean fruit fly) hypothetical protein n=1 Tax=Ceratitis capitata TaxID=7213 RepID=A0A811UKY8_CERCA|nr:unnamed protein product [Ceratitis capitata]